VASSARLFLEATPKHTLTISVSMPKADGKFAMQVMTKGLTQHATIITTITGTDNKVISTIKTAVSKSDSSVVVYPATLII